MGMKASPLSDIYSIGIGTLSGTTFNGYAQEMFAGQKVIKVFNHEDESIEGFENAKIFRPGYAIEYDYFPPEQLNHSLETKKVHGL